MKILAQALWGSMLRFRVASMGSGPVSAVGLRTAQSTRLEARRRSSSEQLRPDTKYLNLAYICCRVIGDQTV